MEPKLDSRGFLKSWQTWDKHWAQNTAQSLGINLEKHHWEVLYILRDFYEKYEHIPTMRVLLKLLWERKILSTINTTTFNGWFHTEHGLREACRLAGLPKPPHCI